MASRYRAISLIAGGRPALVASHARQFHDHVGGVRESFEAGCIAWLEHDDVPCSPLATAHSDDPADDHGQLCSDAVDMLALGDASTGSVGTFKLVWWGGAEDITAARPALDALVGGDAEVVSSLETALEVLPSGASKADGMAIALKLLGEDGPRNVLALGLC